MESATSDVYEKLIKYKGNEIPCIEDFIIKALGVDFREGNYYTLEGYQLQVKPYMTASVDGADTIIVDGFHMKYKTFKNHFLLISKAEYRKIKINSLLDDN